MSALPLIYYRTPNKKKCKKAFFCLAEGWDNIGVPYTQSIGNNYAPQNLAVFYGVTRHTFPAWRECQRAGGDFVYMDNDYFGHRTHWRITRQATQHTGIGEPSFERFQSLGLKVEPWKKSGSHILLVCQSKWWHERHGMGVTRWRQKIAREIGKHTDRAIRVRMKPEKANAPTEIFIGEFERDLAGAWCVVTHSSAVANQAILRGIPAFVTSPCAALTMGSNDLSQIENPRRPDGRAEWAATLAANQWTREEIATGRPWELVMS